MSVFCSRNDTLSMLVADELGKQGIAVRIFDSSPPSGEGIGVYSNFSKENWTVGLTHSVYVASEEDIPGVVRKVRNLLWHEMSLEERADERKEARRNKHRLSATAVSG